jgi:hypothetical protein
LLRKSISNKLHFSTLRPDNQPRPLAVIQIPERLYIDLRKDEIKNLLKSFQAFSPCELKLTRTFCNLKNRKSHRSRELGVDFPNIKFHSWLICSTSVTTSVTLRNANEEAAFPEPLLHFRK